ncbi:MAG: PDZ domain-containing protein [Planctomycetota bacterium]|nr:MAG: PDZ domain-containing protein [Planctomycetota bacterium]
MNQQAQGGELSFNPGMGGEELSQLAAEYVAGELSESQLEAFAELLRQRPELQGEVDFWRKCLGNMPVCGRPHAVRTPGSGFNEVLRQRLQRESLQRRPWWRRGLCSQVWLPGALAALAALTLLTIAFITVARGPVQTSASQTRAQTRDSLRAIPASQPGMVVTQGRLGIACMQVQLILPGGHQVQALQVTRVNRGGPGAGLGLEPGDVVLAVDQEPVRCPWLFDRLLAECRPEQSRTLTVYHPHQERSAYYTISFDALGR